MKGKETLALDTFPKLLLENARKLGGRPAIRVKKQGIWQTASWSQIAEDVQYLASGLAVLSFKRGDRLAVMGGNRPQLYQALAAAQSLGGIPVPIHGDAAGDELAFVLDNADAHFVLAESQEQVDRLLEIRNGRPFMFEIICLTYRRQPAQGDETLISYEEVIRLGREYNDRHENFFIHEVQQGQGDDVSIILYTSGTSGVLKGVCLSHLNLIATARNVSESEGLGAKDEVLACLPIDFSAGHMISYAQSYVAGYCVNCPESDDTFLNDLREIGPTYFLAPPRLYKQLLTSVSIRAQSAGRFRRNLINFSLDQARRARTAAPLNRLSRLKERVLKRLIRSFIYKPLLDNLGLSRIRLAYVTGASIGTEMFDLYRSLGLNLKQAYGLTEASVFLTVHQQGEQLRGDTVGKPIKGAEVELTHTGEVIFRSPGAFHSYFKDPEATQAVKDAQGWIHTDDAGRFNPDGQLSIVGRVSDLGRLNDGTPFEPWLIEERLKVCPYITEAVALGHNRDYVCAMISIDPLVAGKWAQQHDLSFAGYSDLAGKPEMGELISECVERANRDLCVNPNKNSAQIRRFAVLRRELNAKEGELTRTQKIRRRFIIDRYGPLLDELFKGSDHCESEVKSESDDGHQAVIRVAVNVCDVRTFAEDNAVAPKSNQFRR